MSKPTVAWNLIVKADDPKDAPQLARALGSINGYVDAIYIQLNTREGIPVSPKIRQVAEQFTDPAFISTYTWADSFVAARNALMAKVSKKYQWIGWMDTDDIIENPEMIIPSLAVMPEDVNGIYILYDYQKDEHGNVIVSHWTSRVVRNNGSFAWKSSFDDEDTSVHETLIAKREVRSVSNNEWKVIHQAKPEHYKDSLIRNINLLEDMYERQVHRPEGVDPRILFYLASHYFEAYQFRQAKELFYKYLKLSGWAEERSEAHVYMGRLLKMEGNLAGAKTAFLMAIGEYPDNSKAYMELGKLEAKEQRWEQSATWLKRGIEIKPKITSMVRYNNDFEMYTLYAQSLSNLGGKNLSEALRMAQKAYKLRPYDPDAEANRDNIQNLIEYRNLLRSVARIFHTLKQDKEERKILPLLEYLPKQLNGSPLLTGARQEYAPSTKWPKKSIAIYVGHGPLGIWGTWSINEGGTGGSEEAVIRLSNELDKLGWIVTVYAMPGDKTGLYGGVMWKHYWEFNPKDTFDVLIAWRQPAFFDRKFKARKKYLWLHDVMPEDELSDERLLNLSKIIYVSKYHANRIESNRVSITKKFVSSNGIQPEDFAKYDGKFKRDPHRCIYMSANERGLRILYDIWPEVKKAVPDATLDVYYGWHSFDAVNRDNPERMAWKASMQLKAKELDGVTERGRIGQDDLNKEIFKSGIFAYPCFFPEVNCISAQKAMAAGAIPVTSDFAALRDLIQYGEQVPMNTFSGEDIDRYKERLIYWLQHPQKQAVERKDMMKWARDIFAWSRTAEKWDTELSR